MYSDLAFRPPLWLPTKTTSKSNNNNNNTTNTNSHQNEFDDYTSEIRPLLYQMYVACHILRLGTETRFSALVFLHRYIAAIHSVTKNETTTTTTTKYTTNKTTNASLKLEWVAAACLFLACKAEEEPRRLRDVINLAHMVFFQNNNNQSSTSSPPLHSDNTSNNAKDECTTKNSTTTTTTTTTKTSTTIILLQQDPPKLNEAYWETKKRIVETEQIVLRWLHFDVSMAHPHRAVVLMLQQIQPFGDGDNHNNNNNKQRDKLIQMAFRRLNDALFHGPALQFSVLEMAYAAIELAIEEESEEKIQRQRQQQQQYSMENDEKQETARQQRQFLSLSLLDRLCKQYKLSKANLTNAKNELIKATNILKQYNDNNNNNMQ